MRELIGHPELMDKETLQPLREYVARYPYFQVARLLFLHNLFLLHDASFGEELRKAALYVPDRKVLFDMVERLNYEIQPVRETEIEAAQTLNDGADRTESLIDNFLQKSMPQDNDLQKEKTKRKLTVADATTDYAAFLLEMDDIQPESSESSNKQHSSERSTELIDEYIGTPSKKFSLTGEEEEPHGQQPDEQNSSVDEDCFTETLAKIYIKQGRYEKAMEIMRKLNLNYPKKNRYFADQIRFLQKLIINNKNKDKQ